jgi:hypothetical protein
VAGYLGGANAASAYIDGDVAYNAAANGRMVRANAQASRARRVDMMNNPVALVRAALDRPTAVSNPRTESPWQLADITLQTGETLTLAIAAGSGLPAGEMEGARREPGRRDIPHDVRDICR